MEWAKRSETWRARMEWETHTYGWNSLSPGEYQGVQIKLPLNTFLEIDKVFVPFLSRPEWTQLLKGCLPSSFHGCSGTDGTQALTQNKMREKTSREEMGKEKERIDITTHKQRETGKLISLFLLSAGQDMSNKTPTRLSNFASSDL